jgi:LysR family transcriptional regulator, hydrogen peroxide-inducible genes activator
VEIHQLRYFVAVAELGSFSRAAEKVRVAQPSLSQQIQKLEAELGQPLFDRLTRRVVLTEAGHGLIPFAHRILNELSSAQRFVNDRAGVPAGEVKLGMLPTIAPFITRSLMTLCVERYPDVKLNVIEDVTDRLVKMVEAGEVDLAIISTCRPSSGIHVEQIAEEALLAALPKGHPLVGRERVAWRDLRRESVLLLHESHCLSKQIQKWCLQHRVRQKRAGALQLSTLLELVAAGGGISLVPHMAVRPATANGCVFLPFRGVTPKREINLLRNASHYMGKAALAVAELGKELIGEAVAGDRF